MEDSPETENTMNRSGVSRSSFQTTFNTLVCSSKARQETVIFNKNCTLQYFYMYKVIKQSSFLLLDVATSWEC